jgi:hypothetical protein
MEYIEWRIMYLQGELAETIKYKKT